MSIGSTSLAESISHGDVLSVDLVCKGKVCGLIVIDASIVTIQYYLGVLNFWKGHLKKPMLFMDFSNDMMVIFHKNTRKRILKAECSAETYAELLKAFQS